MEIKWLNPDAKFDRLVLAGDIGGTNTNLGLVGYQGGKFTLILETSKSLSARRLRLRPNPAPTSSPATCASVPRALSQTTSA